jgi:hypothetical protein
MRVNVLSHLLNACFTPLWRRCGCPCVLKWLYFGTHLSVGGCQLTKERLLYLWSVVCGIVALARVKFTVELVVPVWIKGSYTKLWPCAKPSRSMDDVSAFAW